MKNSIQKRIKTDTNNKSLHAHYLQSKNTSFFYNENPQNPLNQNQQTVKRPSRELKCPTIKSKHSNNFVASPLSTSL